MVKCITLTAQNRNPRRLINTSRSYGRRSKATFFAFYSESVYGNIVSFRPSAACLVQHVQTKLAALAIRQSKVFAFTGQGFAAAAGSGQFLR